MTGLTNPTPQRVAADERHQATAVAATNGLVQRDLDDLLDEFDQAWQNDLNYLQQFAAAKQISSYANEGEIAAELARVDLDRRYACGATVGLDDYVRLFPRIAECPETLIGVAFEDYRARRSRGLPVNAERWRGVLGVARESWFRELLQAESDGSPVHVSDSGRIGTGGQPQAINLQLRGDAGRRLGDFELVQLLGSGAFSQVFLARQMSLAGRFVALKVVRQHLQEPTHLARLQHTGIVPLYSLHHIGDYSALCMPYCGATTLADWFSMNREGGSAQARDGHSFVETVEASNERFTVQAIEAGSADIPLAPVPAGIGGVDKQPDVSDVEDYLRVWNKTGTQPLDGLRGLTPRDFAIWFAHRLTSALAHAHARGIVHGDIKPANVLIRNDGEPAFIDFNLSRDDTAPAPQIVGGTLPYMAPEQLESLLSRRSMTAPASDVYSLGIVLYELIESRLPFRVPQSMSETDLAAALSERRYLELNWENKRVSLGLRSIVAKCLAREPKLRYPTAEFLLEDIEREKQHLPLLHASDSWASRLSKLTRRFPRVFSGAAIALVFGIVIVALTVVSALLWQRGQRQSATQLLNELAQVSSIAPLEGLEQQPTAIGDYSQAAEERLRRLLSLRAGEPLDEARQLRWLSDTERSHAERSLFEYSMVMALVTAERALGASNSLGASTDMYRHTKRWLARSAEFPQYSDSSAAFQLLQQLAEQPKSLSIAELPAVASSLDALLLSRIALHEDQGDAAARLLRPLPDDSPFKALFWITLGQVYLNARDFDSARLTLSLAAAEAPNGSTTHKLLAEAAAGERDFAAAVENYSKAIEVAGRKAGLLADRARMYELAGDIQLALADVDRALTLEPHSNRLLVYRSRLKQRLGRNNEALEDFDMALKIVPQSEVDWISRGLARANRDPQGALDDLKQALKLNPRSTSVLQNIAFIQSDKLHDDEASIDTLNRLISIDPRFELARSGRCVLLARAGLVEQALEDASYLQSLAKPLPSSVFALACAFSLLSADNPPYRDKAFRYLTDATLSGGGYGRDLLDSDPDLELLRDDERFASLRAFIRIIDGEK